MKSLHRPRYIAIVLFCFLLSFAASAAAEENWTAYNDCIRYPGDTIAENTTDWTIYEGFTTHSTGKLRNFETGDEASMPTVAFTMNMSAPVALHTDYGDTPVPGTEAHEIFDGKVDFSGTIIQHHGSSPYWWVEITFTGLDPDGIYTFAGSAVRVSPSDDDRITLVTISDADSYVNNSGHPAGNEDWVGTDTTKFLAVGNAERGIVVRWDEISPGPDGDFTIRAEADKSLGSHGRRAYPLHGFMLQEVSSSSNKPPEVDAGQYDGLLWPNRKILLNPQVIDDDPCNVGILTYEWSQVSGPGTVSFSPSGEVPNPEATFSQPGVYEIELTAWDELSQPGSDTAEITIIEPDCPVGDFDGDCLVDLSDVAVLGDYWLDGPCSDRDCPDVDESGQVDFEDYSWLTYNWMENRQKGQLRVDIEPQAAVDAGAKWSVDGTTWYDSGYTHPGLTTGAYTVRFQSVEGWDSPEDESVKITYAQTVQASGTYVRQSGFLSVSIGPEEAVAAGAQWRVDDGSWLDSDSAPISLPTGPHTVEFSSVSGWNTPNPVQVEIEKDQTAPVNVVYTELSDATVVISEFMAANSYIPATNPINISTQIYGDDAHPDWLELHNKADSTAELGDWYLTNDPENLTKWKIPSSVQILPGKYTVLFASGKTEAENPANYPYVDEDGSLHTNFNIGRNGGYLALVKPDGLTVAHEYADYPEQRGLISYGIGSNGVVGHLLAPTPGTKLREGWSGADNPIAYSGVVGDTSFSHDRGFYDAPFEVTITCDTPGATILYSLDGSEPTRVYSDPIPITTTTVLRAKANMALWLPSNIDTQTYIFPDDVVKQTQQQALSKGYPSSIAGYPADYEMDPEIYNDPDYSALMRDAILAAPTLSVVTDKDNVFGSSEGIYTHPTSTGLAWERPVSAEYFDPCDSLEFQVNCGFRVQGGASRQPAKGPKHSFSLRFRGGYGPSKLDAELFEASPVEEFDSLQLRAMYNNSWIHWDDDQRSRGSMIRDQWARDCLIAMGDTSACYGTYVHLYINGIYWGLYNVHERPEASHHAAHHGGDSDRLDALNSGSAVDGNTSSWASLHSLVANATSGGISLAEFRQIEKKLDVVNLIDYMIVNHYGANHDWDHHNWRAAGGGVFDAPWRIYSWDAERILESVSADETGTNNSGKPSRLFHYLRQSEEFRMLFADRLHKHFYNDGVMTPENTAARWMDRAEQIDLAIICESARWGDYRRDLHRYRNSPYLLYTKNGHWLPEQDRLLATYFPTRSQRVLSRYRSMGLYPSVEAPVFDPHGGFSLSGFSLTMANASGTILYTLNGADPRLPGGAVNSADAITYNGPVDLAASAHVKARVLAAGQWSALNQAVFAVGPVADSLRITELMYHPEDTGDPEDPNTEYIELQNIGPRAINLNLVRFTDGVYFTFGDIDLEAGEYILVVAKLSAFEAKYGTGFNIAGEYSGRLDNGGEKIRLEDAAGAIIHDFRYRDGWYDLTNGLGFSLTTIDASATEPNQWDEKSTWRPSSAAGGSPAADDSGVLPSLGSIRINEVLAHSHAAASDWIELHNTTDERVDIGGWFLSDNDSNFKKYEIAAGTYIDPCDYIVFREDMHFGNPDDPGARELFALSEDGEAVYLHSGGGGSLTGYVEEEDFGASETGVAFGRYKKSTGTFNFVAMSVNTPGAANALPKVGPVVINEIMYNPPEGDAEYVELYNISGAALQLEDWDDVKGQFVPWRLEDRGGIEFYFPPGTAIPADGYVLVVKDLELFNSEYPDVPGNVQVFEWVEGKLDNGGEKVELGRPGDEDPVTGKRPYIRVDRVNYSDGSHPEGSDPWPAGPDGNGPSLSRINPAEYGNDVVNWKSASPSPGGSEP